MYTFLKIIITIFILCCRMICNRKFITWAEVKYFEKLDYDFKAGNLGSLKIYNFGGWKRYKVGSLHRLRQSALQMLPFLPFSLTVDFLIDIFRWSFLWLFYSVAFSGGLVLFESFRQVFSPSQDIIRILVSFGSVFVKKTFFSFFCS